jgi:chitodextrinase
MSDPTDSLAAYDPDSPVSAASRENPAPMAGEHPDESDPATKKASGPKVGEMVTYRGYESGGSSEHPAIVTGINDDGSVDLTIFYRGSAPHCLIGLVKNDDDFFVAKGQ